MQSLTPREAQVREYVERLEAAHEFELPRDGALRRADPPPDFGPLVAAQAGQWTAQQEMIARQAIEAFITEVRTYEPWTGLADLTPEATEKFVDRSLSIAKRRRPVSIDP